MRHLSIRQAGWIHLRIHHLLILLPDWMSEVNGDLGVVRAAAKSTRKPNMFDTADRMRRTHSQITY